LLVIDGDSVAHRAYHALPPIAGAGDRPINAMVGFANVLLLLLEAERPRAVLACWDTLGEPTYRHRELPAYQAHRPPFDAEIVERYGVTAAQVPDFIALRGDPSDGIPGARGVGAKTAAALLQRFGTLDAAIEHREQLAPRQAAALADPDLQLYRRVATMDATA